MDNILLFYNWFGALFCHQIPERTIYIQGIPLPMCARDTGIYLGIFLASAYIFFTRRFNADRMPGLGTGIMLCMMMMPMIMDGGTFYLGLRGTDNTLRLLTGTCYGLAIPFLLIPAANFKIVGENNNPVIRYWWELLLLIFAGGLCCLLILRTTFIPWFLLSSIIVFSFIFAIGRIVYTILARTCIIRKKYWLAVVVALTLGIIGGMFVVSNFILQPLKRLLL